MLSRCSWGFKHSSLFAEFDLSCMLNPLIDQTLYGEFKMKKLLLFSFLALFLFGMPQAYAGGDELKYYRVDELLRFSGPATASDEALVFDSSQNKVVRLKLRNLATNEAFGTDIYGNCVIRYKRQFLTIAEINAGTVIFASSTGDVIHLGDIVMFVSGGNFASADTFVLEDTLGNDVITFTSAVGLSGAVLRAGDTGVTVSDPLSQGILSGSGLKAVKTGNSVDTAAGVDLKIPYCIK